MTFKGGTSLSKCFNLIHRFSEDIDLILDWRVIGYGLDEPWEKRTNSKQYKFNKDSIKRKEEFLKSDFLIKLESELKKRLDEDFHLRVDEFDTQTVLFEYPKLFNSSYVTRSVRLEIGTLAAWSPSKVVTIVPDLYKIYPMLFEGKSIDVKTVLPERTFWEKVTILHQEANRPKEIEMPKRYARHYYDVYCIGRSEYKDKAIKDIGLLDKVVQFKQKFYPRKWAKYEEATSKNIRLLPDEFRLKEIEYDYKNMTEMFFGTYPTFEELMDSISQLEEEIHKIE